MKEQNEGCSRPVHDCRAAITEGTAGRRRRAFLAICGFTAAFQLLPPCASAQTAREFFEGKTLSFVISAASGGGYDVLGRLVARHLGNHLSGNPVIVVRNMPGAGGIVATNYLYNVAPRDGTTFGLVSNNTPFSPLLGTKQAKYDPARFNWLGTPNTETGLLAVWHTVPVTTIADIQKREIVVASNGAGSTESFYAHLFNATLGTKMKIVYGYPSATEAFLAMQRGEVDGYPSIFYSSLMATHPTWYNDGLLKLLLYFGPRKERSLPEVPFAADLMRSAEDRLLLQTGIANLAVGRPFTAPPDVPADRVEFLRTAFLATFADPKFQADAAGLGIPVDNPRSGAELAEVIAETYRTPAPLVEKFRILYEQ
jgi:tripartite-type tricarboxylate transporter receptor subunit TctC